MNGYINLYRKFLEWEWYTDRNTSRLFLHFLLKANWKPMQYQGIEVGRGQLLTSYTILSSETGLSEREIRTALNHLERTGEVTRKKYPKFTVFTIKNYDKYQADDREKDRQETSKRQDDDTQTTGYKEEKDKKIKNIKNNNNTMCAAAALFERLWAVYPVKKGKGQVSDTQKKRLLAIGEPALVKAIERYSSELQKDANWRKPQNGSTFFNSGYKDYLDENFVPQEPRKTFKQTSFHNFEERTTDYEALVLQQFAGTGGAVND